MSADVPQKFFNYVENYWAIPIGFALIWYYAREKFNTPIKLNKNDLEHLKDNPKEIALDQIRIEVRPYSTTRPENYRRSLLQYILFFETIYLSYVLVPEPFTNLLTLQGMDAIIPDNMTQRVIYGLFGIFGLFPIMPGLKQINEKILKHLFVKASIPTNVRDTAGQLFDREYQPPDEDKKYAQQK